MFRKINITHPNVDDDDDGNDGNNGNNDGNNNYKKAELSCFPNKGWNSPPIYS